MTRNRPESLDRTLASLRAQTEQPFEVIVSDDSDPAFAGLTAEVCAQYGCQYREGPKRGLYANRNAAALACAGSHVRSMDDDHEFPEGHWRICMAAVADAPNTIWAIGEFKPGDAMEAGPPRAAVQLHARGYGVLPRSSERCWSIADGATIFPRAVFDSGCRYAESFIFGAAYLEFGSRLYWLGYRIRNLDGTYVIHHHDLQARSVMSREVDLSSRVFAMLCHSLRYQRSAANMAMTFAQLGLELLRGGFWAARCIAAGTRAFRGFRPSGARAEVPQPSLERPPQSAGAERAS